MKLPPPASHRPPWRLAVPAALALVGIALSCGLACVGSNRATDADGEEKHRRELTSDLSGVLPPAASRDTPRADRLRITITRQGSNFTYLLADIVAVGDFNPANARAFALVARKNADVGFRTGAIQLYSDAGGGRKLVAVYGMDQSPAIEREISARLPPPVPGFPNRVDVYTRAEGLVDRYHITVVAPLTPENAAELGEFLRKLRTTIPGENRFVVKLTSNANGPWIKLAEFDTAQEK